QNLSRDITSWKERHWPNDRLYRGQQLREARAWARRALPNSQEAAFLRRSALRERQRIVGMVTLVLLPVLIISSLLQMIATRPTWCPSFICLLREPVTNPNGFHDSNLEVSLLTTQSTAFVISGDPALYSENNLPESIGAVRIDENASPFLYRVVLGVH